MTQAAAVVIGASAGAIQVLMRILPALPADYVLPVLVVVHLPPGRRSELAMLFAGKCALAVREAEDKESLSPGTVTFAPPDYHLLIERDRTVALSTEPPVFFSRPSIDVLFESAADAYGPALVAVVLTGANEDGAQGLRAVMAAGGTGLVQAPASAYAAAMPLAALAACPQARSLAPDAILAFLLAAGAAA